MSRHIRRKGGIEDRERTGNSAEKKKRTKELHVVKKDNLLSFVHGKAWCAIAI